MIEFNNLHWVKKDPMQNKIVYKIANNFHFCELASLDEIFEKYQWRRKFSFI